MSRSKRKPYFTDQQTNSPGRTKYAKRQANRAVRAAMKKAVENEVQQLADGKAYRKASNSWDIRDWSFWAPNDKKAYRK